VSTSKTIEKRREEKDCFPHKRTQQNPSRNNASRVRGGKDRRASNGNRKEEVLEKKKKWPKHGKGAGRSTRDTDVFREEVEKAEGTRPYRKKGRDSKPKQHPEYLSRGKRKRESFYLQKKRHAPRQEKITKVAKKEKNV